MFEKLVLKHLCIIFETRFFQKNIFITIFEILN